MSSATLKLDLQLAGHTLVLRMVDPRMQRILKDLVYPPTRASKAAMSDGRGCGGEDPPDGPASTTSSAPVTTTSSLASALAASDTRTTFSTHSNSIKYVMSGGCCARVARAPNNDPTLWEFFMPDGEGALLGYPSRLTNLPTVVELHKTKNRSQYIKCADVGQMLIVYPSPKVMLKMEKANRNDKSFPSYHTNGLAPVLRRIVSR